MMQEDKVYQWNPEDEIKIQGSEFNILYQALEQFMRSPIVTVPSILGIADASITIKMILDRMIKEGIAKEVVPE